MAVNAIKIPKKERGGGEERGGVRGEGRGGQSPAGSALRVRDFFQYVSLFWRSYFMQIFYTM